MRTPQELDQLRVQAVMLRRKGKSLRQIKEILGPMSNATLNDALKGEPPPEWTRRPRAKDELHARARELRGQGMDYEEIAAALGVSKTSVSYWVRDMPRPARLSYEECRKRSARRFWMEVTEAPLDQFFRPTLKRHNPKTVRKNVGEDYHGCLRIDVYRSADLYRKIEGWAAATMAARRDVNRTVADEPSAAKESADTAAGSRPVSWNRAHGHVP